MYEIKWLFFLHNIGLHYMGEINMAMHFVHVRTLLNLFHMYGQHVLPLVLQLCMINGPQQEHLQSTVKHLMVDHLLQFRPLLLKEVVMHKLKANGKVFRRFTIHKMCAN